MHTAFVLPRFFPYRGGYENSMLEIARCLVRRGHRVTVFTTTADDLESLWLPGYRGFPNGEEFVDGVKILRFALSYNKLVRGASRLAGLAPDWRWKARYWRPAFHVPDLRTALNEINADIFHVGPLPFSNLIYAGIDAARHRGVPVIATPCTHFGEDGRSDVAKRYAGPHQIALLQQCNRVLCMTDSERSRLAALGVGANKLAIIGHGFDAQLATGGDARRLREKYAIRGPVVLHLGMKAYEKGSMTVFQAMRRLWQRGSDAWLMMAGPSLRAFDDSIAPNLKQHPNVVNLPPFADDEKRDLLAAADLVVQPSRVESLGLVLLEAWANAKPVIAANIAVSRDLVESCHGGVLVPFDDSTWLANEIDRLLRDDELRREMGRRGQDFARRYEGERLWPRYAEEFERLVLGG